jgi:hypothetical protein
VYRLRLRIVERSPLLFATRWDTTQTDRVHLSSRRSVTSTSSVAVWSQAMIPF